MRLFDGNKSDALSTSDAREVLEGTVTRIIYHNPANGYTVIALQVGASQATAVGSTLGLADGETLRLHGQWIDSRKYGRQFEFEHYELVRPVTRDAIVAYLSSGLVEGVGPVMAKRLVDKFGERTLEILDQQPERLTEVEGIGRTRAAALRNAWKASEHAHRVMVFLQQHGLGPTLAARIYQHFGSRSMTIIERQPYRLADEIYGIGFLTADRIAQVGGITPDDPTRIVAGLKHVLRRASDDGHFYLPADVLLSASRRLLDLDEAIVELELERALRESQLIREDYDGCNAYYLPGMLSTEKNLAAGLLELGAAPTSVPPPLNEMKQWLGQRVTMGATELSDEQLEAVHMALEGPVSVITGGPGTGKTTVTRAISDACDAQGWQVALCSPTGRAAKRLSQLAGKPASTIHRLLAYDPRTHAFSHNADEPLQTDLVIVDESSMVDALLANDLVSAIRPSTKIVFIGDTDQLPSVGPGSFFRDLVDSRIAPVVRLQKIFRQDEGGDIVHNAHRIRLGEFPEFTPARDWNGEDTVFMVRQHADQIPAAVLQVVSSALPRIGFLPDDIQTITPMHRGPAGVTELNRVLQEQLNPPKAGTVEIRHGDQVFREGDRLLQNMNNYDKEVYNGDIGRLVQIDRKNSCFVVEFDQGRVIYEFSEVDQLRLAYALTVHKSQGSEYPVVVMVFHSTHHIMLQRNLLYTALTRAEKMAVVIGDDKGVWTAVRRGEEAKRYTRLRERLCGELTVRSIRP
jgi:exodeoxyribonuclease V alpha subunit